MSSIIETKHARPSFLLGAVLIGMATAVIGQSAPAHASLPNKHDGRWSIEVITEKGDCDRAYRYSVLVENGAARYAGSEPITVSGRVASNGAVNGSIAYGDNRANVTGKLADGTGSGRWTWSAEAGPAPEIGTRSGGAEPRTLSPGAGRFAMFEPKRSYSPATFRASSRGPSEAPRGA